MVKKLFMKLCCIVLTLVMVFSMTACNSSKKPAEEKPSETASTQKPAAATPENTNEREKITIQWLADDPGYPGRDDVEKEVKRYVEEKLNVTLDIIWIPHEDYSSQTSTIVSTGSGWDLVCLPGASFNANVSRNAFLALDDYIEKCLPGVSASVPDFTWDAYKYNGKTYGAAPVKDLAEGWGIILNQTLLDETGLEFPADEYKSCFELIDFWYKGKEARDKAHPEFADVPVTKEDVYFNSWFGYDALVGSWNGTMAVTNVDGMHGFSGISDTDTVFCPYYTDDFRDWVKLRMQLVEDGIIAGYRGFDPDGTYAQQGALVGYMTCGLIEVDPNMNAPYYTTSLALSRTPLAYTSYLQAYVNVVNANTKNPERVLEFLNLLYSDEYLCSVLKFGIEGQDWTDEDGNGIVEWGARNSDSANRYWYCWYPFLTCSTTCGVLPEGSTETFKESLMALNDTAVGSPHPGFLVDQEPIQNEIAACKNVVSEYIGQAIYCQGLADPDKLCDEFIEKLKANGMDTIVAEVQSQLDAWIAAH